jgi:hypothetical protein
MEVHMTPHRPVGWLLAVVVVVFTGCRNPAPLAPTPVAEPLPTVSADSTARTPVPLKADLTGTAWFDFANPLGCTVTPFTVVARATGPMSHLGLVEMNSMHCITGVNSQGAPLFAGTAVYRAANGDELHTSYTGTMGPGPIAGMSGEFVITGGTGRFADSTGDGKWSGEVTLNSPAGPWPTVWHKSASVVY